MSGGFSVVNVKFKVFALLAQWIKQYPSSPSSWVIFITHWFRTVYDSSPFEVLSQPHLYHHGELPSFFQSLFDAWHAVDGSALPVSRKLVMRSLSPISLTPASSITTKSCYLYLVSASVPSPHCIDKFFPTFGSFIGLLRGGNFSFSILIGRLSIYPGRSPMVFCILQLVCLLLVMTTICPASVVLFLKPSTNCSSTVRWPLVFCSGYNL